MKKLINYFQAMFNRVLKLGGYLKGNVIYFALSAIIGIVVPYFHFHLIAIVMNSIFIGFMFWRKPFLIGILSLGTSLIFTGWFVYTDGQNTSALRAGMTEGTYKISSPIDLNGDKLSTVVLTQNKEKLQLSYILTSPEEGDLLSANLKIGMTCSIKGTLLAPKPASNQHAFNYKKYLYQKDIHWILKSTNLEIDQCQTGKKASPLYYLQEIRESGIQKIEKYFPKDVVGIVQALLFGERRYITEEVLASYQALGIVHLLAISGLHVGFLTGMFYFCCIRIGITRETTVYILLGFLPLYIILAGAAPSVIRACMMTMLMLISIKWSSTISPLDAISLSCISLLLVNPYVLFEVGFQLSYIVSLSLILSSAGILRRYTHFLPLTLAVTLIAQLSAFPLLLYYFYEISVISIPLNLVFVPLFSTLLLPLSVINFVLILLIEPVGIQVAKLVGSMFQLTNDIVLLVNSIPYTTLTLGKPSIFMLFVYFIVIYFLFISWEQKKKVKVVIPLFLLVVCTDYIEPYLNPHGEVTIIDVGQGDSILIRLPYQRAVYLIDAADKVKFGEEAWRKRQSTFSVGKNVIVPLLKSKGIRKIDNLIITHGDYDHIGSASYLMETLKVKELTLGDGKIVTELEKQLTEVGKNQGVLINKVKSGNVLGTNQYPFHVLSPLDLDANSANDQSIVLFVELGGLRWLFMGDLEVKGEFKLIKNYQKLKTDVVKIGHHGSKTSSTEDFLQKIQPKVGIISVGENNTYGHPAPEVISRLYDHQVKIYRTDENGSIRYVFTKNDGTFYKTLP